MAGLKWRGYQTSCHGLWGRNAVLACEVSGLKRAAACVLGIAQRAPAREWTHRKRDERAPQREARPICGKGRPLCSHLLCAGAGVYACTDRTLPRVCSGGTAVVPL